MHVIILKAISWVDDYGDIWNILQHPSRPPAFPACNVAAASPSEATRQVNSDSDFLQDIDVRRKRFKTINFTPYIKLMSLSERARWGTP